MAKATAHSDSSYYADFRKRLKGIRDDLDWSQAQMAEALQIPLVNYKKYEIRSKFPPHLLGRLALVTHRPVDYIVTGAGQNIRQIVRKTAS